MEPMTLGSMMRQSLAMPALLMLSMVVMAVALERIYFYWVVESLPGALWDRVRAHLANGEREDAANLCRQVPGIMAHALAKLLVLPKRDTASVLDAFALHRQRMQMALTARIGVFGTGAFIAPLIGLMGTVLGIMRAFRDLAVAGAGGPTVVAAGISEALISTAAGIAVAVVSAILFNFFTFAAKKRLALADVWVLELIELESEAGERKAS
jgi:biopolymer transport protein ExbB